MYAVHQHCGTQCRGHELPCTSAVWIYTTWPRWLLGKAKTPRKWRITGKNNMKLWIMDTHLLLNRELTFAGIIV